MKQIRYIGKTTAAKLLNSRTGTFLLVFLAMAWRYDRPYLTLLQEQNQPITWCIFPFFMASVRFVALYFAGIVYANSDVPFMQHSNMYQVIRTGRRRWALGQISGIFLRSLALSACSALLSALPFFGRLEPTNRWGRVAYTMASEGEASAAFLSETIAEFTFHYDALASFSPAELMALTLVMCTLIGTFLGLLMFLLSLYAGKAVAVGVTLAYVLLVYLVQNTRPELRRAVSYFIPPCWAEIALYRTLDYGYYRLPPMGYMFGFLLISIAVMSLLICLRVRHVEFNWENEDA